MKGKIFSIEEFAVFDGPGIRITVFLKGCPLSCMWCHSPEGQAFKSELIKSPNGCIGCGACEPYISREEPTDKALTVCPRNLIRLCGEDFTAEELFSKLSPKLDMVNSAGGGITFSGGEPLAQSEFLLNCLRLFKGKTNRAVQTSGFADEKTFMSVLEECDYMLFDLKIMNKKKHIEYTAQSNKNILNNYRILAASGVPFITRIPLIPTVNDTAENIEATAAFMSENGVSKIEILPYNTSAGAKYAAAGKKYMPTFPEEKKPEIHPEIFEKHRIEVTVL